MPTTNMAEYMANRRKDRRSKLIEMSGGQCVKCGSTEELHFDHKDPKQQEFRLTGKKLDGSWEKILEEASKCQLLCRPCHVEKTKQDGTWDVPWNKGISKYGDSLPEHGCEAAYMRGCRCRECYQARHNARVRRGEISGSRGPSGQRGVIKHGTRAGYSAELRFGIPTCAACRKANAEDTKRRKKLADGITSVVRSAVTGDGASSNLALPAII